MRCGAGNPFAIWRFARSRGRANWMRRVAGGQSTSIEASIESSMTAKKKKSLPWDRRRSGKERSEGTRDEGVEGQEAEAADGAKGRDGD